MYRIYFTDDGTVLRHENVCGFGTGKGHSACIFRFLYLLQPEMLLEPAAYTSIHLNFCSCDMGTTREFALLVCSLVSVRNCGKPRIASRSQSGICVLSEFIIMHVNC